MLQELNFLADCDVWLQLEEPKKFPLHPALLFSIWTDMAHVGHNFRGCCIWIGFTVNINYSERHKYKYATC